MSKEQTPITARKLTISIPIYNHLKWTISRLRYFNEYYPTDNQRIELIFSIGEMFKNRHEESKEQYAQSKVLEALEREKELLSLLKRSLVAIEDTYTNEFAYSNLKKEIIEKLTKQK